MKNALISPNEQVSQVTGWEKVNNQWIPISTVIANAQRVAEVATNTFPIAEPLFWVECADNVIADEYYYDSVTLAIVKVPPPAPIPVEDQPVSQGTQSL